MFRKKQTRGHTTERIEARQNKKKNKNKKKTKKRTASKEIIIAIGCCFMTDVSIYI